MNFWNLRMGLTTHGSDVRVSSITQEGDHVVCQLLRSHSLFKWHQEEDESGCIRRIFFLNHDTHFCLLNDPTRGVADFDARIGFKIIDLDG